MRTGKVETIAELTFNQVIDITPTLLFIPGETGFYRITVAEFAQPDSNGNPQSVSIFTTIPAGSVNDLALWGGNYPPAQLTSLYLESGESVLIRTDQNNPTNIPFDLHVIVEKLG